MGIKERLQDRKEKRERQHARHQRMAEISISRAKSEQASRERKHRWYMASSGNKSAEREHFAEVARNLEGLDDHLLMVTNFGPSDSQAEKIAEALKEAGLPLDIPIGISTHEHLERPELHYEESARDLAEALRKAGFVNGPTDGQIAGIYTETGGFSYSLRTGAKITADWYESSPKEVLHVAVVSSLDTAEVGIPKKVSIDGSANLFRGVVAETGLPVWNELVESRLSNI